MRQAGEMNIFTVVFVEDWKVLSDFMKRNDVKVKVFLCTSDNYTFVQYICGEAKNKYASPA